MCLRKGYVSFCSIFRVSIFLLFLRRGSWITLKLRKLIKSSSREQGPDQPPALAQSGIAQPQHFHQDNGSFVSSDSSGSSISTSAGDIISPQSTGCEYNLHHIASVTDHDRGRGQSIGGCVQPHTHTHTFRMAFFSKI